MAPRRGFETAFEGVYKRHGKGSEELDDFYRSQDESCEKWTTLKSQSIPEWLRNSPYLLTGHRPPLMSYWLSLKSVFRLHTETGNIWSHLLGALYFLYLGHRFFTSPELMPSFVSLSDRLVVGLWFFGQTFCCLVSAVYHTFLCHSEKIGHLLVKFDYIGIFVSCWATLMVGGYFSYYCDGSIRLIWYSIALLVLTVGPYYVLTENRLYRVIIYSAVVLPNAFAFHAGLREIQEYHPTDFWPSIQWLIKMYLFPISAAVVYLFHIPERLYPGAFDYLLHSHQLMHILVLGCMYSQYKLLMIATRIRFYGYCDLDINSL